MDITDMSMTVSRKPVPEKHESDKVFPGLRAVSTNHTLHIQDECGLSLLQYRGASLHLAKPLLI